jgi:hypothetical protein
MSDIHSIEIFYDTRRRERRVYYTINIKKVNVDIDGDVAMGLDDDR